MQVSAAERAKSHAMTTHLTNRMLLANSTWHGTHTAGVVAATANNAAGIAGIGWNVKIFRSARWADAAVQCLTSQTQSVGSGTDRDNGAYRLMQIRRR